MNEYAQFRSKYTRQRIAFNQSDLKTWTLYDSGPKDVECPLVFLPPVSGTADVFFLQLLELHKLGYRVISLQYPACWTLSEFIMCMVQLLDHLNLRQVHLFGASLGGFLAQKFAENTHYSKRVHSLILCNSFPDTSIFNHTTSAQL